MVFQPLRSSKELSKPKDQQMASQPSRSFKKLMARHGIKPTCYCNKCNEMNKLLKKNIEQFKKKSCVYNARHKFSERICISSVMKRLKLDLGKFANKISGPGDDPCYNTPHIYYSLVEYETYNNYIDYLEKNAEDDEIAGPSLIAESKPFQLVGSESHWYVDEIMAKNGIQPTCRCDKCYVMVKLLDEEAQRYLEKSITFWFRHHNYHCVDKLKMLELIKTNPGKFDNNVTELREDFCVNSRHIYKSLVEFESLNNHLDHLDNNLQENGLVNPFLIAESKSDHQMVCQPCPSLNKCELP
ncbi:GSCOCG00001476001-RA-CDS [Cotesia congregata]|nr:GSCOCG00001476001-RA-CDS [Cotesia congregata]